MRKILAAGFLLLCLMLSGCTQRPMSMEDLDFQFDCKAEIHCQSGGLVCAFQRTGRKNATVQVLSGGPEGLLWDWDGDGFTLMYLGLAAKSETCNLPQDAFAPLLVNTLDRAEEPGALTRTRGNEFSGRGVYDFTLTADPETGKILTLSVPDCGFESKFYDYAQKTISVDLTVGSEPD